MYATARSLRRSAVALVALAALAALTGALAAPAGAADTVPGQQWVDTFCTETVTWLTGASDGATALQNDASDPSLAPTKAKALLVKFFSTGVGSTKQYGKNVAAGGTPDFANGDKIRAAILGGIAGSLAKLTGFEKAAKALPTKPKAALQKGGTKILNNFST
jgi:hypothetical protein